MLDNDSQLLQLFKQEATKEKAFEQLVKQYQERLYWHIRRMLIKHDDTNDVLQNVFIKVWKSLHAFREDCKLYTWLYKIATNECITYLEQQKKRSVVSWDDEAAAFTDRVKADTGFDASKLEWKLQLAIQALPEKQKLVFNLRYFDEMPYEEMSKILDTSEGALKASYFHAAKKVEAYILSH